MDSVNSSPEPSSFLFFCTLSLAEHPQVVRADIVLDPNTRRSKGFGTILFQRQEDANAAIQRMNDTEFEGRTISVRLDRFA